nr:exo-alpha-sialidase [Rhodococcus sp. ENV425]
MHGLHVDATGTILAGTHNGLMAVDPTGRTQRVGASDDDFMGLTGAAGTDTLYASGHPGPSSSAPNPLGLRRSTDAGLTWVPRSLEGEVDFHALAADGATVVGFDGTSGLRISTDGGASWKGGATLAAADLAVVDGQVWAVTSEGVQHSTDTARSFTPVPDAPALVLLSGAPGAVWGVDRNGYAWRSRDGRDWQQHSYVGAVEALAAVDYDRAFAVSNETLHTLR